MVNFFSDQSLSQKNNRKKVQLHIIAAESYVNEISHSQENNETPLVDLKKIVKESSGKAIRRITRFVQLAVIGANRCCKGIELDSNASVYFSSCRGDTGVTVDLLNGLVRDQQPPAPLSFVNSVSNAACFQVAKSVGALGASNFITNRFDPIFSALQLSWSDFAMGTRTQALIGSVDCCSEPLNNHRRRIHVDTQADADIELAEASNWLLVSSEPMNNGSTNSSGNTNTLGTIEALEYFSNIESCLAWLNDENVLNRLPEDTVLGVGQHLNDDQVKALLTATGIKECFHYVTRSRYYDSPTGEGIVRFLSDLEAKSTASTMLHVNTDPSGRMTVLLVTKP